MQGIAIWSGDPGFDGPYDPYVAVARWVDGAWVDEDVQVDRIEDPGGFRHYDTLAFARPDPFEPGDRFRVQAGFETAIAEPVEVEIEVGEPLPAITGGPKLSLGEMQATTLSIGTTGGSCDIAAWSATRRVAIELPTELEPYRDLLLYETTVYGVPWRPSTSLCSPNPIGRSWQDATGNDLLAAACAYPFSDYETVLLSDSSTFGVQVHAYFPGTTYPVWSTQEVQTQLTCPSACVEFDASAEEFVPCPSTPGAGDAGSGAGDDDGGGGAEGDDAGGGGCASVDGSRGFGPLAIFLVGLLRRGRRRRTASQASGDTGRATPV